MEIDMNGNIIEQSSDNLFRGFGIEVYLDHDDDFLKVMETLTRIGIANNKTKSLYQSCHILHKRGRYAIVHFKELFALDNPDGNHTITEEDIGRRTSIAKMLDEWGLVELVTSITIDKSIKYNIKVVKYSDKNNWQLIQKYRIGS